MAHEKKTQVFHFDPAEPGDMAALDRLMEENGGEPPVVVQHAIDFSTYTLVFPQVGLLLTVADDGMDYLIRILTAAREFKAERLAAAAEEGGG